MPTLTVISSKPGHGKNKTETRFKKGNTDSQTGKNALYLIWAGLHLICNVC